MILSGYAEFQFVNKSNRRCPFASEVFMNYSIEEKKGEVDYIHGVDVTIEIGKREGNLGIILPDVSKDNFFSDMLKDGAYPRKTFSIGHANEKRYYMEARKIK